MKIKDALEPVAATVAVPFVVVVVVGLLVLAYTVVAMLYAATPIFNRLDVGR